MNALANSASPYLRRHAESRVNWLEWSYDVFKVAKRENKPLFVSIGYASCFWDEKMHHESFENEQIAALMNERFLCVKVDRDERPEIAAIYQKKMKASIGENAWPLNFLSLPNRQIVFVGSYFPPKIWHLVLSDLARAWRLKTDRFNIWAEDLTERQYSKTDSMVIVGDDLTAGFNALLPRLDATLGGAMGESPLSKPSVLEFLLTYARLNGDERAAQALDATLTQTARSGLFDHVGGGFMRRATDAPTQRLEKRLIDNALWLSLYSRAADRNDEYLECAENIFDFIENELVAPDGGLNSACFGDEGEFYLWKHDEWLSGCEPEWAERMAAAYNVTPEGSRERGLNLPLRTDSDEALAGAFGVGVDEWRAAKKRSLKKLYEKRSTRAQPLLDEGKSPASMALAAIAYCDFALAHPVRRKQALDAALRLVEYLNNNYVKNKYEVWRTPETRGFADDYAYVVRAFCRYAQVSGDAHWWKLARHIVNRSLRHFYDSNLNSFSYAYKPLAFDESFNETPPAVQQPDDFAPSFGAVMMHNVLTLGKVFNNLGWEQIVQKAALSMRANFHSQADTHADWGTLMARLSFERSVAVVAGSDVFDVFAALEKLYRDRALVLHLSRADDDVPVFMYRFEPDGIIHIDDEFGGVEPATENLFDHAKCYLESLREPFHN